MSNIKARLMKPTGQDFLDVAYDVDREIWNFLKHTFKKATGGIPARYGQTHAVPIHQECWEMIGAIKQANSIYPPYTEATYTKRRELQQSAIGHLQTLYDYLKLTLNEIESIDANKLNNAFDLMEKEDKILRGWKASTVLPKKAKQD